MLTANTADRRVAPAPADPHVRPIRRLHLESKKLLSIGANLFLCLGFVAIAFPHIHNWLSIGLPSGTWKLFWFLVFETVRAF